MISALPLMPAIWRDKMAVGTCRNEIARICSPKPSRILSHTASVASGVMSRDAGPVPPLVTIKQHPWSSLSSFSAISIFGCSSGTKRVIASHLVVNAFPNHSEMAGPLKSSYSPRSARSDIVTIPIRAVCSFIGTVWCLLEILPHPRNFLRLPRPASCWAFCLPYAGDWVKSNSSCLSVSCRRRFVGVWLGADTTQPAHNEDRPRFPPIMH